MKVRDLAYTRTGDKGNSVNVAMIAKNTDAYHYLKEHLTADRVKDFYSEICLGTVRRYDLDTIESFNFVLTEIVGGGVTRSLSIDRHGKSLGMSILDMNL